MLSVATGVLQRAARGSKLPEFWKSTLVWWFSHPGICYSRAVMTVRHHTAYLSIVYNTSRISSIARFRARDRAFVTATRYPIQLPSFLASSVLAILRCPCDPLIRLHPDPGLYIACESRRDMTAIL